MVQGFYSLEEAAQRLNMSTAELSQMAQRREVRAFADRGTWRFRTQDIEELARQRGMSSDPGLQLGESSGPKTPAPQSTVKPKAVAPQPTQPGAPRKSKVQAGQAAPAPTPTPSKKSKLGQGQSAPAASPSKSKLGKGQAPPAGQQPVGDVFPFELDPAEEVDFGTDLFEQDQSKPTSKPPSNVRPGSDSDVRLVSGDSGLVDVQFSTAESSRRVAPGSDSDVRLVASDDVKAAKRDTGLKPAPMSGRRDSSVKGMPSPGSDSDVRLVQADQSRGQTGPKPARAPRDRDSKLVLQDDSSVRLDRPLSGDSDSLGSGSSKRGHQDSGVRLKDPNDSSARKQRRQQEKALTDESIDLDAELSKAPPSPRSASGRPAPQQPFELSEDSLELPTLPAGPPSDEMPGLSDSSEVELTPAAEAPSDELHLDLIGQEFQRGSDSDVTKAAGTSGINLAAAADSGLSLEGSGEVDFNLPVEDSTTGAPAAARGDDSSSEFELTLEDEGAMTPFELSEQEVELPTVKEPRGRRGPATPSPAKKDADDSDSSEFELTLDDDTATAPLEEELGEGSGRNLFETDLDLAVGEEDESSSQVVPLTDGDTDVDDSSEFELAIDDDDSSSNEAETGSEVIVVDEDAGDADETRIREGGFTELEDDQGLENLFAEPGEGGEGVEMDVGSDYDVAGDVAPETDRDTERQLKEALENAIAAQAPPEWGPLPALMLLPAALVMGVVGLLLFEMIQSIWSYEQPTFLSGYLSEMFIKFLK